MSAVDNDVRAAARDLVAFCQALYRRGWMEGTSGNLSVHLEEPDRALITASGVSKGALDISDAVVVRATTGGAVPPGARKPSAEAAIHAAIYRTRPDCRAVVHAHTPYATLAAARTADAGRTSRRPCSTSRERPARSRRCATGCSHTPKPRIAEWMRRPDAEVAAIARDTRAAAGAPQADAGDVIEILTRWADDDVKATPLKTLQGLIWAAGFAAGELTGHVYDDIPAALARWRAAGIELYVYSSGSVRAQRDWFAHTDRGDLSGQFKGWFDTACPGPKAAAESYRAIAAAVGVRPAELVFLSDSKTELDAAAAAGLLTIGVRRAEDGSPDVGDHRAFADLASVPLHHTSSKGSP